MLRCVGHCCRCFYLREGETFEQVHDEYAKWQTDPAANPEDEIQVIAPMLVPRGKDRNGRSLFTCKHLKNGKNCGIYATRPDMCREVGTEVPCLHPYCRLKKRTLWQQLVLFLTEKRFAF